MSATVTQRQVTTARISRSLIVAGTVIEALLFALHVAHGAFTLAAFSGLTALVFALAAVFATLNLRRLRRTRELDRPATTGKIPSRERALRHLASRPRRIMTPDDYRRLGELERELGWEPSEAPEAEAKPPPQAVTGTITAVAGPFPRAAALSGTGSLSAKAWHAANADDARDFEEQLREQVIASQGIPPARLTDGEVKDATEAAQHFAQLARVGLEFCVSYCPICAERLEARMRSAILAPKPDLGDPAGDLRRDMRDLAELDQNRRWLETERWGDSES